MGFLSSLLGGGGGRSQGSMFGPPVVMGDESIMSKKEHGTSWTPVQSKLKWGCDVKLADKICNFNRHYAEHSGYFESTSYINDVRNAGELTYYDSNSGKPLFVAPKGRTFDQYLAESRAHGWYGMRPRRHEGATGRARRSRLGARLTRGDAARTRATVWLPVAATARPSFRDEEVVWENVRILPNGEAVSVDGTHLGHNLPDRSGNRYCINLVCVAGSPQ
jgi:hypothetical protein